MLRVLALLLAAWPFSPAEAEPVPPCTGEVVWRAPLSEGTLGEAWPLERGDRALWRADQTIAGGTLRVDYPAGSINPMNRAAPQGGAGFADRFGPYRAGCLTYRVRFDPDFAFAKGGKLPGLFGGRDYSGCSDETDRGFSTRMMWGRNGTFFLYAYFADRVTECGEVLGSGVAYAQPGTWHVIEQRVDLGPEASGPGRMTVLVDGIEIVTAEKRRITPGGPIEGLAFETFFGGSGPEWASPRDQGVAFAEFTFALP